MNRSYALACTAIFSATTLLIPAQVSADDDTGFYVSATINRLSADFEDTNDVNFDDSDNTVGIRGGYMFNNTFGVELGYIDLGSYSARGDTPGNSISLDADAFTASAVLNFSPTENLDVYGKLGAFFVEADSNSRVAGSVLNAGDDATEPFIAIGVEYDFGLVNLFGEISKADTDVRDLTVDIITLGVKYEFNAAY